MSCAYLMFRDEVDSDNDGYRKYVEYISKEVFFNTYDMKKLFNLFQFYGWDSTTDEMLGYVEINDGQFSNFLENYNELDSWNAYDLEILEKIKKYFNDGNWLLQLMIK